MNVLSAAAPSTVELRKQLLDIVNRDLLGPAGGPKEEVDERSVRDRYLTGILAPRRQGSDVHGAPGSEEDLNTAAADDQLAVDGGDDELAVSGTGTPEEGMAEPTASPAPTFCPSSLGLSFSVDSAASTIIVNARWGQYLKEESSVLTTKSGNAKRVWRRYHRSGVPISLELAHGQIKPFAPDADCPDVFVQGTIRKRQDCWSVTLFLVNGQTETRKLKDSAWLFQPELSVSAVDNAPVFICRTLIRDPGKMDPATLAEEQAMNMLYREHLEFAVGHGVSVHTESSAVSGRAQGISTSTMPTFEAAQATPPDEKDFALLAGLVVDMKELAETPSNQLRSKLWPLVDAYEGWIRKREKQANEHELKFHQSAVVTALDKCRQSLLRLKAGIELLETNEQAAEAFRFANRAMWLQRVRTLMADANRQDQTGDAQIIDIPKNRSWRTFQLAFILVNLPAMTDPTHPERNDLCDLLWFPTGGGKTEAYLGLSACVIGIRRLQGVVAGRSGDDGIAVLMRYTLRLLTLQQFQRAAALICACEMLRQKEGKWGATPFRLGLWVGQKTTPNTTEQSHEAIAQAHGHRQPLGGRGGAGSPHQITFCPWCGSKLDAGRDIKVFSAPNHIGRTLMFCSDPGGKCPFTAAKAPLEGIPVIVVDEEIYRLLPAMLIATVDKFAQMPWNGKVQVLFGRVESRCERHGFRSPETDDALSHGPANGLPAAKTVAANPLRPPDLIIQDELHLISGPLGSLVGIYETAVDHLSTWKIGETTVRPKIVASTATIRKALDQVHGVFGRNVSIFLPHGLDVTDSFFALERPIEAVPGRLYVGICAPGRRLKAALIRVYVAFLAAGQELYEKYGVAADPWMTVVGYFNSMLELGGMRRLVEDDVKTRLGKADQRGMTRRTIPFGAVDELTSRKSSTDIPQLLDRMERKFDPAVTARRHELIKRREFKNLPPLPLDVLLATNMISVGVDVKRLGLMAVAGQPKSTAEYIQATSRVGRSFPGLVCCVYNWTRPRDLSHYETFEHYHATFYKHVEALSVTPFSPGAMSRALTALLVSCIRLGGSEFNSNQKAGRLQNSYAAVHDAIETIAQRAHKVADKNIADQVRAELKERVDKWQATAQSMTGGAILGYRDARDGVTRGLLHKPGLDAWHDFTCLNSLRDVEPMVNLIFDDGKLDEGPAGPGIVIDESVSDVEEEQLV
ncbi:MAG: DISARM system helicase DrmA [Bryobacteraceae bacterium]